MPTKIGEPEVTTYEELSAILYARTATDYEALFDAAIDTACMLHPDEDDVHVLVDCATAELNDGVRKLFATNCVDPDTAERIQLGITDASERLRRIADMFADHVVTLEGLE